MRHRVVRLSKKLSIAKQRPPWKNTSGSTGKRILVKKQTVSDSSLKTCTHQGKIHFSQRSASVTRNWEITEEICTPEPQESFCRLNCELCYLGYIIKNVSFVSFFIPSDTLQMQHTYAQTVMVVI
jgi:hypothetical protein